MAAYIFVNTINYYIIGTVRNYLEISYIQIFYRLINYIKN